jgi:hypothetical protein
LTLIGAAALLAVAAGWVMWPAPDKADRSEARHAAETPSALPATPERAEVGSSPPPLIASASPNASAGAAADGPVVRQIDLEEYAATRNATAPGAGREPTMSLPKNNLRLTLRLPENSRAGLYAASLINGGGRTLVAARARSRDGRRLSLNLDLRRVAGGKYRLSLARTGEPPQHYRVLIE